MDEEKVISLHIFDPKNSIFKDMQSKKAGVTAIICDNYSRCDLYKEGKCIRVNIFNSSCKYGRKEKKTGYTKNARGYEQWIADQKMHYDFDNNVKTLESAISKMAVVGDWIYLPYPHMNMNEKVPFENHSRLFVSGTQFIQKFQFNVNTIKDIVEFKPQALMPGPHGREIFSYQEEVVPLFLSHLNELFPDLYKKLFETYPDLIEKYKPKEISYIGRKAYLLTLNKNITFSTNHKSYPVTWMWDGKTLKTESSHAYDKTWGKINEFEKVFVELTPNKNTVIEIQNNSWVNENTKFKD